MADKTVPLVTLETERLRIVPLDRQAFDEKCHASADDPLFGGDEFREAMEELAERAAHDKPARFAWYTNRLIYRREDGAYIGSAAFMNSPEKDPDKIGLVEIGYATEEPYRGRGYMTEAITAMAEWAFSQPKVYGLIAGVQDPNPASDRVLEKCGFVKTDHSDTLALSVWKRIPEGRRKLTFWQRLF
ncbi:MAG: GNAT family N-acetyltransferase [Ruminococcaceae bacterium]|nr:GNAT family N-acetyltransferase [Oscillospiraceae bacterium]